MYRWGINARCRKGKSEGFIIIRPASSSGKITTKRLGLGAARRHNERWVSGNNISKHANQRNQTGDCDRRVKYVLEILNQTNYNLKSWHTECHGTFLPSVIGFYTHIFAFWMLSLKNNSYILATIHIPVCRDAPSGCASGIIVLPWVISLVRNGNSSVVFYFMVCNSSSFHVLVIVFSYFAFYFCPSLNVKFSVHLHVSFFAV